MKKLLGLVVLTLIVAVNTAMAVDIPIRPQIPNIETSELYSTKNSKLFPAMTSKILEISVVDIRVGWKPQSETLIGAIGFDIKALELLGAKVKYMWTDMISTSISTWGSFDFATQEFDGGVMCTLITIDFE